MASQIGVEPTTFRLGVEPMFCPFDTVKCKCALSTALLALFCFFIFVRFVLINGFE